MDMPEVPANNVCSLVHTIPSASLFEYLDHLHDDANVIKIEYVRRGADFRVTVYFAVMDIALRVTNVAYNIEQFAKAAKGVTERS